MFASRKYILNATILQERILTINLTQTFSCKIKKNFTRKFAINPTILVLQQVRKS